MLHLNGISQVVTADVYSQKMKKTIPVLIIKAPSIDTIKNVVYLLHGYGGAPESWLDFKRLLLKTSKQHNVLFVAPDGGNNSYYLDAKTNSQVQYETFIVKELPIHIDTSYFLAKNFKKVIIGHSMGGYGAFRLALIYKSYNFAGAISGVMDLTASSNKEEIINLLVEDTVNGLDVLDKNSVMHYVSSQSKDTTYYEFICGRRDYLAEGNKELAKLFKEKKFNFRYTQTRFGRHTYRYFKKQFPKLLEAFITR